MPKSEYFVEQADIFDKLKDGEWFYRFVKFQYQAVVFRLSEFQPLVSEYLCTLAHQRWVKDVTRVSDHEYDGGPLDHFKQAALLCYWLRRYPPISELSMNPDVKLASIKLRNPNGDEVRYANQMAAFDLGFRLCRFWEANRVDTAKIYGKRYKETDFTLQNETDFLMDVYYVLADKNVSPHTLALIYRSLFINVLKH